MQEMFLFTLFQVSVLILAFSRILKSSELIYACSLFTKTKKAQLTKINHFRIFFTMLFQTIYATSYLAVDLITMTRTLTELLQG